MLSIHFLQRCTEDPGKCFPVSWYCDGKVDCPEGSDELGCNCEAFNMVNIKSNPSTGLVCFPPNWDCEGIYEVTNMLCNARPDCIDNDEESCQGECTLSKREFSGCIVSG